MNDIQHVTSWLSGKKTYLIAVTSVIYAWGITHTLWPHNIVIDTLLGAGGVAALRSGIKAEAVKIAQAALSDPPVLPSATVTPAAASTPKTP